MDKSPPLLASVIGRRLAGRPQSRSWLSSFGTMNRNNQGVIRQD